MVVMAVENIVARRPAKGSDPMRRKAMKDVLLPLGVLVVWFVLNRWVLPRMGVPT
jgi:hypothetical protein